MRKWWLDKTTPGAVRAFIGGEATWWIGDLPPQNYEPDVDEDEEDDFMGVGI